MSLGRRIFAATYDRMGAGTEKAGLRAHRQAVLANSRGRVLEIGGGTGANLPFYGEDVEALTVTEPETPMGTSARRSHGWPAGRTGSMLSTSSWSTATATGTP